MSTSVGVSSRPPSPAEPLSPQELLKAWNGMSERARAAWVLRMDQPTAAALSGAIEKERKTHAGI